MSEELEVVAVMQPYFFPRLAYFQLINESDTFVLFDSAQMIVKGWVRRNRIIDYSTEAGWSYINVPVSSLSRSQSIGDVLIDNTKEWRLRIRRQLENYSKAPFYSETTALVSDCLDIGAVKLVDLLDHAIRLTADHLGIETKFNRYSNLGIEREGNEGPGDWALLAAKHCGASTYINPVSGRLIYDDSKFERSGLNLRFLEDEPEIYSQNLKNFLPRLSIIDTLMFNGKDDTSLMLERGFQLVS